MHHFSIIGPGRMGGALAIALSRSDAEISDIVFRRNKPGQDILNATDNPRVLSFNDEFRLETDVIIIATADPDIPIAVKSLIGKIDGKPLVLHTSGSLSSDILAEFRDLGCSVGSMHPLLSVSDPLIGSETFASAFFCIEGDPDAIPLIKEIVTKLGGKSFAIETKMKPLYHAAAVMACGHLTALIDMSSKMLVDSGIPSSESTQMLMPLIKSTINNIDEGGLANALTGSFARGDVDAVDRHIDAIKEKETISALLVYLILGEHSLRLAESAGLAPERIEIIREHISMEKSKLKC
jgi:predicted short-subunit dehydrogenase-like oxidoreductase (DUF2520 family)